MTTTRSLAKEQGTGLISSIFDFEEGNNTRHGAILLFCLIAFEMKERCAYWLHTSIIGGNPFWFNC